MKSFTLLSLMLVLLIAFWNTTRPTDITIIDYIGGSDYEIIKVDGQTPNRLQRGSIITKLPYVVVSPGKHELMLKFIGSDNTSNLLNQQTLTYDFQENTQYKIKSQGRIPIIVIQKD